MFSILELTPKWNELQQNASLNTIILIAVGGNVTFQFIKFIIYM